MRCAHAAPTAVAAMASVRTRALVATRIVRRRPLTDVGTSPRTTARAPLLAAATSAARHASPGWCATRCVCLHVFDLSFDGLPVLACQTATRGARCPTTAYLNAALAPCGCLLASVAASEQLGRQLQDLLPDLQLAVHVRVLVRFYV